MNCASGGTKVRASLVSQRFVPYSSLAITKLYLSLTSLQHFGVLVSAVTQRYCKVRLWVDRQWYCSDRLITQTISDERDGLVSCGAGFCAAAGKVKNDLACETHLKFHFASLSLTQLIILRCQNSTANTT
jgi:hypothetical protein